MPANPVPVNPVADQGTRNSTPRRHSSNDGVYVIFLGACIILLLALTLLLKPTQSTAKDFRVVYFPAKALLAGLDPYNPAHILQTVHLAGEDASIAEPVSREIQVRYVYPPTAFAVTLPFALLPWRAASVLWMVASTFGLILSAFLAWDLSREHAPTVSAVLIAYLLANSEVVVVLCNPSALAISLAVTGTWCLLKHRQSWFSVQSWSAVRPWIGVVLFALSLCLKPQDAGLIWCFFLLTSPALRRRSLQIAIVTAALSIPMLLWVWHVSPNWSAQLHANYVALSTPGGPADPGPLDPDSELVNLQVPFSRIKDAPDFYNTLSYLAGGLLLAAWALLAWCSRRLRETPLLSLATVVPLSLLPLYHHFYDTKLLLLCIPGFAVLWSTQQPRRWTALALNLAALIITGDLSHTVLNRNHLGGLAQSFAPSLPVLLAPAALCALGVFNLWALWQASRSSGQLLPPHSDPATPATIEQC
jgi:hypothetical protein